MWEERDEYGDMDEGHNRMSHQQQVISDRYDMVREKLERGEIDETQAAEMRMGA